MYYEDSDDGVIQQPSVYIKPRRITKDTPQEPAGDFFSRKPHVGPEEWDDALEMWEALFHTETINHLPIKILWQKVKQALQVVEMFKGDNRFDQELLLQWEQEIVQRMDLLELVSNSSVFILNYFY